MSGGARAGAGRKAAPIDLIGLEKLCAMHCSDEEIAGFFSVSVRTIQKRRKQPEFGTVMRRGKAKGSISVRRAQMRMVEDGSVPMAIWLGKNVLGQRDTIAGVGMSQDGPVVMSLADVLRGRIRKREEVERHGEKREEPMAPVELLLAA
jgi:hypothetical protein